MASKVLAVESRPRKVIGWFEDECYQDGFLGVLFAVSLFSLIGTVVSLSVWGLMHIGPDTGDESWGIIPLLILAQWLTCTGTFLYSWIVWDGIEPRDAYEISKANASYRRIKLAGSKPDVAVATKLMHEIQVLIKESVYNTHHIESRVAVLTELASVQPMSNKSKISDTTLDSAKSLIQNHKTVADVVRELSK